LILRPERAISTEPRMSKSGQLPVYALFTQGAAPSKSRSRAKPVNIHRSLTVVSAMFTLDLTFDRTAIRQPEMRRLTGNLSRVCG
jgi:hypothetical protein